MWFWDGISNYANNLQTDKHHSFFTRRMLFLTPTKQRQLKALKLTTNLNNNYIIWSS